MKSRNKALTYVVVTGLALTLGAAPASGQGRHVGNRCPRLSASDYDELDARILLLLKEEAEPSDPPTVVCGPEGSWVEWRGERLPVVGRALLVDEVVDVVERALHAAERRDEADPRAAEAAAVDKGVPVLERGAGGPPAPPAKTQPADPVAVRSGDARGGGLAVSIETEHVSDSIGFAVGPAFDFAMSAGPLLLGGREAFRFRTAGRQTALMDFQLAAAFGAPFNPDKIWGAALRVGAEWMVAYPEGNSGQASMTPTIEFGLRFAHGLGRVVGLWVGADARFRTDPVRLQLVRAADVSGSLSVGVAFVDWSRK